MKIGIFDSGLGGLFLMKPIVEALPQYDYLYLGDTANLPYGDKSPDEVYKLARAAVKYLSEHDCALVLVMCNTISAEALRKLQGEGYRALGIIIPTVESITGNRIGVLATQGTVNSKTYIKEIHKLIPHAQVFQHAAPKLVPMIEAGELTGIELILKSYLEPLIANHMDTLILGCTHYPILKSQIEQFLPPNVRLICQNEIISEKLISYLTRHPGIESTLTKSSSHRFLVTKLTPHFKKEAKAWFGDDIN